MADKSEKKQPEDYKSKPRRNHGEGSIYFNKARDQYVASYYTENGQRKYAYGKTKSEVREKLQKALWEKEQGTLATGPDQTLKSYLPHWLDKVHRAKLRLSTYTRYRIVINKHILPSIGYLKVQKLTALHLQTLYSNKLDEGLAPGTVKLLHAILHTALDNAVRVGIVSRNVCNLVDPPQSSSSEAQTLTVEQAHKLLETARGNRLEAILIVALTTGMRHGELLALKWHDIDVENNCLYLRRNVSFIAGHGHRETEPKTAKGRRKIALPLIVIEVLKEHRVHQLERRLKAGANWQELDLVFCNARGYYMHSGSIRTQFRKLLKEAGLARMRFHDLRHSAATILLSMGVHPKIVQEILGHSNISMTMDRYSHVLPSLQKEAIEKWDKEFGNEKEDHKDIK